MSELTKKVTLKQLQSQLSILDGKRNVLKNQVENIQQELSLANSQMQKIKNEINRLQMFEIKEINISEHAILRYIERVLMIDIEQIKSNVITDELKKLVSVLGGSGSYPVKDFKVVMVNKTITTITN